MDNETTRRFNSLFNDDGSVYGPPLLSKYYLTVNDAAGVVNCKDPTVLKANKELLRTALYDGDQILLSEEDKQTFGLPFYNVAIMPGHTGYAIKQQSDFIPYADQNDMTPVNLRSPTDRGPKADHNSIVVIGKCPNIAEFSSKYFFFGNGSEEFQNGLRELGITDFLKSAYFTACCKFVPPNFVKFKQSMADAVFWFTWAELMIIRPKLVVLCGAEVIKKFHGSKSTLGNCRGSIIPYKTACADGAVTFDTIACLHPWAVVKDPAQKENFVSDLNRVYFFVNGIQPVSSLQPEHSIADTPEKLLTIVDNLIAEDKKEFAIDCEWHGRNVYDDKACLLTIQFSCGVGKAVLIPIHVHNKGKLPTEYKYYKKFKNIVVAKPDDTFIVQDCDVDITNSNNLFLFKLDGEDKLADVEILNQLTRFKPTGFDGNWSNFVLQQLTRLLKRPGVVVGGHNFRADFPWLKNFGLDLTEEFRLGFDTMLMHHAMFEGVKQDLSSVALKYTNVHRYDTEVWSYFTELNNLVSSNGFGMVPEKELYAYALYDADITFRIKTELDKQLSADAPDRKTLRNLLQDEMNACIGILEIEDTGIMVDRDRISRLGTKYAAKRNEFVENLKKIIRWPNFNYRSVYHVRELLYGETFNGKLKKNDVAVRLRPEDAVCVHLEPIKTTSKPAKNWQALSAEELSAATPSTDKETLGILSASSPIVDMLRKIRFLDQVCKMYVTEEFSNEKTDTDAAGNDDDDEVGGLLQYIDPDQRVRTSIFQATETGRWSSARPNLQNLPKRREKELHQMFSEHDKPENIRSVFLASPDKVMIQADFKQAELIVLAVLSGDPEFWSVLMDRHKYIQLVDEQNKKSVFWLYENYVRTPTIKPGEVIKAGSIIGEYLYDDEWHQLIAPVNCVARYTEWERDLHAERAISGFKMPYCPVIHGPPKGYVESTAKDKRVAAKTVNFGIPYGRSANAIARELQQENVIVTADDTQKMIDGFYNQFQLVGDFLNTCKANVASTGLLVNPFGRWRRFFKSSENSVMAQQEREASNFPIQSSVAELLNKAVWNFIHMRDKLKRSGINLDFKLLLGVHDAILLESDPRIVPALCSKAGLITICMSQMAKIPLPDKNVCLGLYKNANSERFSNGGFALDVDVDVFIRWDEKASKDELISRGVPASYFS